MKKILLVFILLFSTFQVIGQTCPVLSTTGGSVTCASPCTTLTATVTPINATTSYTVGSIPYSPYSFTSGTGISTTTDDIFTTGITIPFCFNFFGNSYTTLYIGSNGNVSFNPLVSGAFDPWSISGPLPGSNCNATYAAIMATWCDMYPPGGGTIRYQVYGTAPCRAFVISYNNVAMFLPGSFCTGNFEQTQIVLYETTNIIDIYIGKHNSPTLCTSWNSGRAVTGIENLAGTLFYTVPGQNGTAFTAVNQGWRFSPSGSPFTWTFTWSDPSGVVTPIVCPTVTTTYTCTATATTPCGIVTLTSPTVVNVISTSVTVSGPTQVCKGNNITMTTSGSGGIWSSSNSSVASVATTGVVTGVSTGISWIKYTNGLCEDSIKITVNPTYFDTTQATICDNQFYTFCDSTYNLTGTYVNHYFTNKGCDSILVLNLNVNPTYNQFLNIDICQGSSYDFAGSSYNSSGIYSRTFTTVYGCDSIVNLNLTVHPNPSANFYCNPYICVNDTVNLSLINHSDDVTSYTWDFQGGNVVASWGTGGPFLLYWNQLGLYDISLIISNSFCSDTTHDTISVMDYPDAKIADPIYLNSNSKVCFGDSILFKPLSPKYEFHYLWSPLNWFPIRELRSTYGIISDTGWVRLTVTNPNGCSSTDSLWIPAESCCGITFPSAFTPNGDGKNDVFRPIGNKYFKIHTFIIQNRYGQTVFETSNPNSSWDGTFGGVPQDLGVYFWYIEYDCDGKGLKQKGDVTLIR